MAFLTGTATNIGNMLVQLFDFAAANGWVIDEDIASDGQAAKHGTMHHASMNTYYHFDFVDGQVGDGTLSNYISTGFTPLANPDDHPGLFYSGGHPVTHVAGALPAFWFFEHDTYLHVVLKNSSGNYRHFHLGIIGKLGDWTGGDYLTGQTQKTASNYIPTSTNHVHPFDGADARSGTEMKGAVVYATKNGGAAFDFAPNVATKWYVSCPGRGALADDDGVEVGESLCSGTRGGIKSPLSTIGPSVLTGAAPLLDIPFLAGNTGVTPNRYMLIGSFPDVRIVSMKSLSPESEYVVAGDTWVVFPATRKGAEVGQEQSQYFGYAYKKVVV